MQRTRHPGIYKRGSRYVVVWRYRGRQHKESFATLSEAREAKGRRQAGDRRPVSASASRITLLNGSRATPDARRGGSRRRAVRNTGA